MSLLGKLADPIGLFSKEGPKLPDPLGILGGGEKSAGGGGGGGLGLPDPLGLFGEGGLPDPLGLFESADGASSGGSSSAKGGEEEFNIFDPLGLFGKSGPLVALSPASVLGGEGGPPLPPGLRELLAAARPEAASLVGGFPV